MTNDQAELEIQKIMVKRACEKISHLMSLLKQMETFDAVTELIEIATELDGHAIHLRYPKECDAIGLGKCTCGLSALRERLRKWTT